MRSGFETVTEEARKRGSYPHSILVAKSTFKGMFYFYQARKVIDTPH
jgi:hypothetical protein